MHNEQTKQVPLPTPERKRRRSQNNHLLREIMERLRDYEPDEVVVICNKFRRRRNMPLLGKDALSSPRQPQ